MACLSGVWWVEGYCGWAYGVPYDLESYRIWFNNIGQEVKMSISLSLHNEINFSLMLFSWSGKPFSFLGLQSQITKNQKSAACCLIVLSLKLFEKKLIVTGDSGKPIATLLVCCRIVSEVGGGRSGDMAKVSGYPHIFNLWGSGLPWSAPLWRERQHQSQNWFLIYLFRIVYIFITRIVMNVALWRYTIFLEGPNCLSLLPWAC